jgi:SAM-dependent methyltransferase
MKTSTFISRTLLFLLLAACIVLVCSSMYQLPIAPTATPTPTATLTPTSTPTVLPTLETIPDTGWYWVRPGLERRSIKLYNDQDQQVEALYLLRLDPNLFQLDVAFHETARTLETWQTETGALIVVNGGYFRIENNRHFPNGLTIVNGETFGSSYDPFAGMLAISDSKVELRWLADQPYDPYEPLRAALQSFPVLVKPGGVLGFAAQHEDNLKARRTVIGQDRQGRILFMVAPRGYFTLHQLSLYLTGSDLQLHIALNLDGGPSSGILLADPQEIIPSLSLLPFVILVYPR